MNLRTFDLNLLLIFDAIYTERSISKAAERLSLSQPAVSNSLARLRDRLDDPLFQRTAEGMVPTARARALAEPVRQALDLIGSGLQSKHAFDYRQSKRTFVIAVEDYGEAVILPRFVDWVAQVAPEVRIKIRPEPANQLREELKSGRVDLAIDYFVLRHTEYVSERVMTDSLLSLTRPDHPGVGDKLTLETYLQLRHVALLPRNSAQPMIDLVLARRRLERHIAVEVPHFQSMPIMVQTTSMICTLPKRMATLYADQFRLKAHIPPVDTPDFPIYLVWHKSAEEDMGHRWLRESLMELCGRL